MNILKDFSIRTKLIIISVIPLSVLLYFLITNINRELQIRQAARDVLVDAAEVELISDLVNEIQKERMNIVTGNKADEQDNIINQVQFPQRELTNKAISSLRSFLTANNRKIKNDWIIDSLPSLRIKADNGSYSASDNEVYISGKELLLEEIIKLLRDSKNINLKNNIDDHINLIFAKDLLGRIRRILGDGILNKEFSEAEYGEFSSAKARFESNFGRLRAFASPSLAEHIQANFQVVPVQQTLNAIDIAYSKFSLETIPLNFTDWYSASTTTLNLFRDAEDFSNNLIRNKSQQELASANSNVILNIVLAVAIIAIIISIVYLTIKNIIDSVSALRSAALKMADGDTDLLVTIDSRDEIGNLAESFNEMINVNKEYSNVADIIGNGDYSPEVKIRSKNDLLGKALDNMKNNLRKLSDENEKRTWLLTGSGELNDTMRGEKDIKILAQDLITKLATFLKAQIGAIYIRENGRLNLVGSYAFDRRKENTSSFNIGSGLIGQSALEKKSIIFSNIPEDYIQINSGLGNSAPRNILVYPFLYDGEVNGVVELGSAYDYSDLSLQFMDIIGENIGIAFNSAQSRTKLKELLEETQRQAEELEAQQEELKQSNEELQEKTSLLEKSEAELKAQQEELQQTNEELEEKANMLEEQKQILEDAKMEIETKARELEATSKYKSEFLANMSHELRTPLNSILILSQLLAENKSNVLGDKEIQYAVNIKNSGSDLLNLINEILDLSKVEAGKTELEISDVAFNEITGDLHSMFSEVAANKSIKFNIKLNNELLSATITTDKQRLIQILRNLLSNAFKFTPAGGNVDLIINKIVPGEIIIKGNKLSSSTEIVEFIVSDTGIGVPENKREIIFEAFQQADGSTKRQYGGTGLGLSISRELAGFLGGEIQLKSIVEKGSSFILYLPCKLDFSDIHNNNDNNVEVRHSAPNVSFAEKIPLPEKNLTEENIIDDRYNISKNDRKILIMEDDEQFAKLLLDFIRERGYKGIIASFGNTGLSFARHYQPDAILLDLKLPVLDGTEVLKQLKNDPELRHIPVQIISGYDKRKETLELGAFDFLKKPVTVEILQKTFDKIENFVSKKLKKLLIIEDNIEQNDAIRNLIGNGDVKCYSSYSGQEAFNTLNSEDFDCIIVDLGLPDMSGFELLEKLKADSRLKKVPVIVYTARDLKKEESIKLSKLANTVVLKTANSQERLLDETTLFLHRVESKLPPQKQSIIRKLHKSDEVLKDKKVLVVDDDIRNIYSLTNLLEEEGLQCITAENGIAAIEELKQNPDIDIVLMDIMMPEMDGYEATREIRKMPLFTKIPIIALTAKAMKGDREKCLNAGMSDYISKPVNITQLFSLMRVWLYK